MSEQNEQVQETTAIVDAGKTHPITPSERILAPLELSDYSQFLYETNYGGKKGQDFTAETWNQIIIDLKGLTEWVKAVQP